METIADSEQFKQDESEAGFDRNDRRLLIDATLRLFRHRLRHNIPISQGDVLRLVEFAAKDTK